MKRIFLSLICLALVGVSLRGCIRREPIMLTKTWQTKADWESGTLNKVYCPIGLNRLEIAYDELSGTATYIVDGAEGWSNPHDRKFNWQSFEHSKENTKIVWRDDFREDSRARYGYNGASPPVSPGYDADNHRLTVDTGESKGFTLWVPSISIKNVIAQYDIYVTSQYSGGTFSCIRARHQDGNNTYAGSVVTQEFDGNTHICKVVDGNRTDLAVGDWKLPLNVWRTHKFEANESSFKLSTAEGSLSATDGALTWAKEVQWSMGPMVGYIDNFLVQHYTLPDPPNCSISFKFWPSDDGESFGSEYTDITRVPNSRYIKIEATLSRNSFLGSAMPVLNSMTLTYKLLVSPIFI